MRTLMRFGRRVPLPSTVQILHDLLLLEQKEKAFRPNGGPIGEAKAEPESDIPASTPHGAPLV
jgi:hypothetical protein